MKKIQHKTFSHKKVTILLMAICFVWFQGSKADNNDLNFPEDPDRDGLTNREELSIGTDPQNSDTDGDGYSDGIEFESGWNPLVDEDERTETETTDAADATATIDTKENMTDVVIESLVEDHPDQIEAMQNLASDPEMSDPETASTAISLTEDDVNTLIKQAMEEADINDGIEAISEEEINILPEVDEEDESKRLEEEKKQVEAYFIQAGYIIFENAPSLFEDGEDGVGDILSLAIGEMNDDIIGGDRSGVADLRQRTNEIVEELKELEAPYVLKGVHQTVISLLQHVLSQDESAVFDGDDPLALLALVGKAQRMMAEFNGLGDDVGDLLGEYELESFEIPDELAP
ncbi:MAG: hypothetical protein U9M90_01085 [Patescibacteria group bacterium]|nr:hypothetical protein [Patescibacteria group bacterium]